jgi:hypothetical protein
MIDLPAEGSPPTYILISRMGPSGEGPPSSEKAYFRSRDDLCHTPIGCSLGYPMGYSMGYSMGYPMGNSTGLPHGKFIGISHGISHGASPRLLYQESMHTSLCLGALAMGKFKRLQRLPKAVLEWNGMDVAYCGMMWQLLICSLSRTLTGNSVQCFLSLGWAGQCHGAKPTWSQSDFAIPGPWTQAHWAWAHWAQASVRGAMMAHEPTLTHPTTIQAPNYYTSPQLLYIHPKTIQAPNYYTSLQLLDIATSVLWAGRLQKRNMHSIALQPKFHERVY